MKIPFNFLVPHNLPSSRALLKSLLSWYLSALLFSCSVPRVSYARTAIFHAHTRRRFKQQCRISEAVIGSAVTDLLNLGGLERGDLVF